LLAVICFWINLQNIFLFHCFINFIAAENNLSIGMQVSGVFVRRFGWMWDVIGILAFFLFNYSIFWNFRIHLNANRISKPESSQKSPSKKLIPLGAT
jgi:NADH:ubiquinone oxidoreductase subunit 5 (subunit L)/multisubunit Na+/H+ antiporter MnhA subunit